MRIVLFYSEIDPFNFGTDQLSVELQARGHETFILDLRNPPDRAHHSYANFLSFISYKVDMVICFDGIGIREDVFVELWDSHQAVVADILLDPPFRFHPTLIKHPKKYLLFCCDLEHLEYVKKYFGQTISYVRFMPHAGVMPPKNTAIIPYEEKNYDILFTGTYYDPQSKFTEIKQIFPENSDIYPVYQIMFEKLIQDSSLSIEKALLCALHQLGWNIPDDLLKTMLRCAESVDWAIRMYQRKRIITVLAEAGMEIHLLGRGWENHPSAGLPNIHRINDRIPYEQTLSYMAQARINLNIMPWFKAGSHDRIINALLQHSVPLTDPSTWITDVFTDHVDIALYDLKNLDQLPEIVHNLLMDVDLAESIIRNGYKKAARNFTWSDCTDQLLKAVFPPYI